MSNRNKALTLAAITATLATVFYATITAGDYPPFDAVDNEAQGANNINISGASAVVLNVTQSGTADNWVIIDGDADGDGANAQRLCVRFNNVKYVLIRNVDVTGCSDHAVITRQGSSYIIIEYLVVYRNDKRETGGSAGSWPSALKAEKDSSYIVFRNNLVYENFGEGMDATMSNNVWGYQNTLIDNWSQGFYADNSNDIHFWGNRVSNTGNAKYSRFTVNGKPTNGCALVGAENYTSYGWTVNRIRNIFFRDNQFENCKTVSIWNPVGAAVENVVVTGNTFYNTAGTVTIPGAIVSDNVVITATPSTPATPAASLTPSRTVTVSNTPAPSSTPTVSRTPSPSVTSSRTPTRTATAVSTATAVCQEVYRDSSIYVLVCK